MKTRLFLVRHGETVDNANQIMQGQTQGELNEEGFRQARELRDELAATPFDAVIASDLHRSVQTAELLAEPHGLKVVSTPLLRERDWGSFTGRYIPDLKGAPWSDDIESLDALLERARRFLQFVRDGYEGQTVLAVGHGIINKAIQAVYYDKQMRDVERMGNCEVRILELS
jgi:probable phosphoglycerate mutase